MIPGDDGAPAGVSGHWEMPHRTNNDNSLALVVSGECLGRGFRWPIQKGRFCFGLLSQNLGGVFLHFDFLRP